MRCGEQCFIITFEQNKEVLTKQVNARSSVLARKKVKEELSDAKIITVIKQK